MTGIKREVGVIMSKSHKSSFFIKLGTYAIKVNQRV